MKRRFAPAVATEGAEIPAAPNATVPANEDELHQFVLETFGYDVPQVAVCEGHESPMRVLWRAFSGDVRAMLVIANRGGGKTLMVALLHYLLARFRPGHESMSLGAIELQAQRAYRLFQNLLTREARTAPDKHPLIASLTRKETDCMNGSRISIAGATLRTVNGPHPHALVFDELEVLEDGRVFDESRAMTQSGAGHPALDVITSTRKWVGGRIQRILDQCEEAQKAGHEPPFEPAIWCVFEVAENVPNCGTGCGCEKVVSGRWDDGSPRCFDQVCQGRLKRSQGWLPLEDVRAKFVQNSRDVWESQFECARPSTEGMVLPTFSRARHTWGGWTPHPRLGPVFQSIDWGYVNASAVLWFQLLTVPVKLAETDLAPERVLPPGTFVIFDEVYESGVSGSELSDLAWECERKWKERIEGFRVAGRFYDSQGRQNAADFLRAHPWVPGLRNWIGKGVHNEVMLVRQHVVSETLLIDATRCPNLVAEAEAWRFGKKRADSIDGPDTPVSDFDHALAALRYGLANVTTLRRKGLWPDANAKGSDAPQAPRQRGPVTAASHHRYGSGIDGLSRPDPWGGF